MTKKNAEASKPAAAQEAVARSPLSDQQIAELLPVIQNGWTIETYATWAIRAAERAHGITYEAAPVAAAAVDRAALLYLMQQFDAESWQCPQCGHAEDTATMDSAHYLRRYLAENPVASTPAAPGIDLTRRIRLHLDRAASINGDMQAGLLLAELDGAPCATLEDLQHRMADASPKGGSDALREAAIRARRCLAWACEQRPEFNPEYEALDAALQATSHGAGVSE